MQYIHSYAHQNRQIRKKQDDVEIVPKKTKKEKIGSSKSKKTKSDDKTEVVKQDEPVVRVVRKKEPVVKQKPTIRIIRREDVQKKKEEEEKIQEEVAVVETQVPVVEVKQPETKVDQPVATAKEEPAEVKPVTTDEKPVEQAVTESEPVSQVKPKKPTKGKVFIKPPKPMMPVQAVGKAMGMEPEKPPVEDVKLENLDKILTGKTYRPGEEKKEESTEKAAPSFRDKQFSASGQRLDGFQRSGGKRKKKTSRKEKKAAQKAREKQLESQRDEEFRVEEEREMAEDKVIKFEEAVTVKELCDMLRVNRTDIIKKIMNFGIMNVSQKLDIDVATLIAEEYGFTVKTKRLEEEDDAVYTMEEDNPENLEERPPIVTVMGHVDHGKTSLLDCIRKTNVVSGESGGITQHIGAYQVLLESGKKITFLDTPGHEAFTAMRAHGAAITDIAVLVVAADDGVQPTTIEAIDHAIAAEIPIIVAINKIDRPEANIDKVKQDLAEHGLTPEDWGGDTICVEVSAIKNINISGLLDMIMIVSEMKEYKSDHKRPAVGVIIEAKLDKGKGPVATVLVQTGTIKIADPVVIGNVSGKIRTLTNDKGKRIKSAGPSSPVEIVGISSIPEVGQQVYVVKSEKAARSLAEKYDAQLKSKQVASKRISLNQLFDVIARGEIKDLNVILKGDVTGSVTALKEALERLSTDKVRVSVVHCGVGQISENDVMLASASNALIVGFHVRPSSIAEKLAQAEGIEIRNYRIIYDCINDIKLAMDGLLDPTYKEIVIGRVKVRETFKIPKIGVIAGAMVTEGKVIRSKTVRLVRDGVEIFEGKISSLKRFKDDANEVREGFECGIGIENYNDIKVGDEIEVCDLELIKIKAGEASA